MGGAENNPPPHQYTHTYPGHFVLLPPSPAHHHHHRQMNLYPSHRSDTLDRLKLELVGGTLSTVVSCYAKPDLGSLKNYFTRLRDMVVVVVVVGGGGWYEGVWGVCVCVWGGGV